MLNNELNRELRKRLYQLAFDEDIREGDHTSLATLNISKTGKGVIHSKAQGLLAGLDFAKEIFQLYDDTLNIELHSSDGSEVSRGDKVLTVKGKLLSINTAERLVLNLLQHLSGIATKVQTISQELKGTSTKFLDTRKTTPGLRVFEKYAVKIGGAENHRMGLFDMILIKDNHIDACNSVSESLRRAFQYLDDKNLKLPVVCEVRKMEELEEALDFPVTRVLIDNFTPELARKAVSFVNGKIPVEASGGIHSGNARAYAEAGVDYISTSALTRNFQPLDLSLTLSD